VGEDVREQDGPAKPFKLDRKYQIELPINVPARGIAWFVLE